MKIQFVIPALTVVLLAGSISWSAPKADPDMGNETFDEQCASCHNAYSTDRKKGPGLKGLFTKGKLETTGKPADDANVLDKIEKGGNGMPPFKDGLSAEDKLNLIAYLKTL